MTVTIRVLGKSAFPKALHQQPTMKEAYLPVGSFRLWGSSPCVCHRFGTHLEAEVMETGRHHLCTLPLPHYSPLVSPRKELLHSAKAPVFTTAAQWITPGQLALVSLGLTHVVPQDFGTTASNLGSDCKSDSISVLIFFGT